MEKIGTNQGHLDNGPGLIKVVPVFVGQYAFSIYHWPTLFSLTMYFSFRFVDIRKKLCRLFKKF